MTTTDNAHTYIAVLSRKGGKIHLSTDGDYTLCHWVIRPYWQRHEEHVALFTVLMSDAPLCAQCARAALAERAAP